MSCGWAPSIANEASAPRSAGSSGPWIVSPGTSCEALQQLSGQRQLVRTDRVDPDLLDEVDRRTEADRLGDLRGPGLELAGSSDQVELVSNTCLIM